ncbi:hypothetical protein A8B82_18280 [Sulfitobacter sp. EhC04]|nr:hypothetical protein A8B82_18280 [Sulfitobacter sp. EhC04]
METVAPHLPESVVLAGQKREVGRSCGAQKVRLEAFPLPPARNQGRRPPRIAGPSPGTAIWLLLSSMDSSEVLGCH